jgi:hypothetical protein
MRLSRVLWAFAAALLLVAPIVVAQPRSAAPAGRTRAMRPLPAAVEAGSQLQTALIAPLSAPSSRRAARSPLEAARGFLSSYLAVSYGRAPRHRLRNATRDLRAGLERNPPHANNASATNQPQVLALHAQPSAAAGAVAVATVSDGAADYAVTLALQRVGHRWLVTNVGPS